MLIRFSVSNFLSFRDESTFEMIAGGTDAFKEHTFRDEKNRVSILKSGIIYGANASGKSNFIRALSFGQEAIINGLKNINTLNKHFRLEEEYLMKPSLFQFEIKINDKYYDYGFKIELNKKKIVEEWLYEKNKNKEDFCIFYREENKKLELAKKINKLDKSKVDLYYEDLREEQLLLKELTFKKWTGEELKAVESIGLWFRVNLEIIFPDDKNGIFLFINKYKELGTYLNSFDTGIEDVSLQEKNFDEWVKDIPILLKEEIQNHLLEVEKDMNKKTRKRAGVMTIINTVPYIIEIKNNIKSVKVLNFEHIKKSKELFELVDESDGTKRLIELIPILHNIATEGKTVIIDEIDRSFHPALTRKIFEEFFKLSKNKPSQLIATTHDTNLLDLEFLRRDEIWFVNRENDKSSKIYSLEEFKERKDKKVEKAYLLGRYGGIPAFGNFDFLKGDEE